jgi:REP element-mobilizing transposase RayT
MAQSLSKVYFHIIFSTKNRGPTIVEQCQPKLWAYLAGGFNSLKCHSIKVGGVANHVHASIDLGRTVPISDLIREVKGESSKWMKRDMGVSDFSWQAGYGAFSVSASQRDQVAEYIAKQKEHHAKQSFQDEYRAFLQRYEIDYDERYVWD